MAGVGTPDRSAPAESTREKYLTIVLGAEEYGVDVMKVQEIISLLPITRIPRTPAFIRGVINLRGRIVPVMELRARFGMSSTTAARETCIVVVRSAGVLMGFIVDSVRDMLDVQPADRTAVPEFGMDTDTRFLSGIARRDGRVVLLLDIAQLIAQDEVAALHALPSAVAAVRGYE